MILPKKFEAILHYKRPETKTEVNSFLGLTGYYRTFVCQHLNTFYQKVKRERVDRTPECEHAFQDLKRKLSEPLVLIVPVLLISALVQS